ncbi:MAG: VWA domain-containing protein, partial [Hyphomicrobiales bacterium]
EDLPYTLRTLKPVERQAAVDKNLAERNTLNERLATLVKKRDAYVIDQRKKAPARSADSFDRAVAETLKAQIKR